MMANATPVELRLIEGIELGDHGCWLWVRAKNHGGYGTITVGGKKLSAHRVAFETLMRPIPENMQIDHLCSVRHCINPEHMECVSGFVNTMRGKGFAAANALKTHCPHGHRYEAGNTRWTIVRRHANGYVQWGRRCRECIKLEKREYRARKRREREAKS